MIKGKKAIKSIKAEKNIPDIQRVLETYKSTLTLFFSHLTFMASSGQILPAVAAKSKFYEVPAAMRVNRFIERKYSLDCIQKFFKEGVSVVILVGMGGNAPRAESEPIQSRN